MTRANLNVGSRPSQLILALLVVELSLTLVLQRLCQLSQEMPIAQSSIMFLSEGESVPVPDWIV